MKPKALGGAVLEGPAAASDRRVRLAAWLSGSDPPFFAKSLAKSGSGTTCWAGGSSSRWMTSAI